MSKIVQFPSAPPSYRINASSQSSAEIFLYDVIGSGWMGGISADQFRQDLRDLGSVRTIDVRINSDGGDVSDGRAIYSLLSQHPANINVYIDGLAASIASLIAMAGDQIFMADGALFMLHNSWGVAVGNAGDMRKQATVLDIVDQLLVKTYCARTKMDPTKCAKLMADETWMNAEDCLEMGFIDKIIEPMQVAACVHDLVERRNDGKSPRVVMADERFRNVPTNLRPRRMAAAADTDKLRELFK